MRYLKMLGLAAVAAMALTAFLGAGSASATVFCKTTNVTSGCAAAGWAHGSGTEIHAVLDSGQHATLNGFWTDVTCRAATVKATTTNTGGASSTVTAAIEALTFSECSCSGGAVGTAHVTTLVNGTLETHWIEGTDNGTVTGAETVTTADCTSLGTQCRFGTGTGVHLGTLTGGHIATVDGEANLVRTSGTGDESVFVCGSEAAWEAKFEKTSPETLFVSQS